MKKLALCLLLFSFVAITQSQAQTRIAIAGGVHSSSVNTDVDDFDDDNRFGYRAGLILDVPLSEKFAFQPGAMFMNKGRKIEEGDMKWWQYTNYIDVPLNFVFKAPLGERVKFIIGAGPYASFLVSGRERTELTVGGQTTIDEVNDLPKGDGPGEYDGFNYGWNALAGFEFGRLFLTANYSRGLNDFYNPGNEETYKHQVFGGTLGFFLNRAEPKVRDRDNDGVMDNEDECPDQPGTIATRGCPDRDSDGIADKDDQCPDQAGTLKYNGCPIPDSDNDGINDELDKCPNEAGVAKYDGCPIPDSDNDGINDEMDKCPNQAGVAKYDGCPIPDTDGDGLNDEEDRCPTTYGPRENNGCPEINSKLIDKVSSTGRSVQFTSGTSYQLTSASRTTLNNIAQIMNDNPDLNLTIEGHVSDNGNAETAMTLSENRANAVKDYLVSQGVSADRISTQGYGASQPISNTASKNNRIELKLSNQ